MYEIFLTLFSPDLKEPSPESRAYFLHCTVDNLRIWIKHEVFSDRLLGTGAEVRLLPLTTNLAQVLSSVAVDTTQFVVQFIL